MNHGASKVSSKNMKLLFSSHPQISCFKLLEYSLGKMFSFFFFSNCCHSGFNGYLAQSIKKAKK